MPASVKAHLDRFQSPLHRGISSGAKAAAKTAKAAGFQSPLHRGISSGDSEVNGVEVYAEFQSPLHRGISSGAQKKAEPPATLPHVSIPSSSGHLFGHMPGCGPLPVAPT